VTLMELHTGKRPTVTAQGVEFNWDVLQPPAFRGALRMALRTKPRDRPSAQDLGQLLEEVSLRLEASPSSPLPSGAHAPLALSAGKDLPLSSRPLMILLTVFGFMMGMAISRYLPQFSSAPPSPPLSPSSVLPQRRSSLPKGWVQLDTGPPRFKQGRPASPPPLALAMVSPQLVAFALPLGLEEGLQVWTYRAPPSGLGDFRRVLTLPGLSPAQYSSIRLLCSPDGIHLSFQEATARSLASSVPRMIFVDWRGLFSEIRP
jgi:hypothetical protein